MTLHQSSDNKPTAVRKMSLSQKLGQQAGSRTAAWPSNMPGFAGGFLCKGCMFVPMHAFPAGGLAVRNISRTRPRVPRWRPWAAAAAAATAAAVAVSVTVDTGDPNALYEGCGQLHERHSLTLATTDLDPTSRCWCSPLMWNMCRVRLRTGACRMPSTHHNSRVQDSLLQVE